MENISNSKLECFFLLTLTSVHFIEALNLNFYVVKKIKFWSIFIQHKVLCVKLKIWNCMKVCNE